MVLTGLTPVDIIGEGNMVIFKKFYEITASKTSKGEFPVNRINKEIGAENREAIAATLQELRDNGFYPDGFKADGNIHWKIVLKSPSQVEFEKGLSALAGKTREECAKIARGYKDVLKAF